MRRPESNGPGVFSRRGCGDVDTRRGEVLWGHSGRRPSPSQGEKPLRRPALQTAWPCSSSLRNCESTPLQLQLPNLWRSAMKALTIQPLNLSDSTFLLSDFCSRLIIIYWKKCLDWDSNYACFIHSFLVDFFCKQKPSLNLNPLSCKIRDLTLFVSLSCFDQNNSTFINILYCGLI